MSQMKTEIIPVVVGALEVIKTGSEKLSAKFDEISISGKFKRLHCYG